MKRRQAWARLAIRLALIFGDHEWRYGLDLKRATGLRWGRFYKALYRMEEAGTVEGRFEDGPEPRRRMYRLTEQDR